MNAFQGHALHVSQPLIARVRREHRRSLLGHDATALVSVDGSAHNSRRAALLSSAGVSTLSSLRTPCIAAIAPEELALLRDGDIVVLNPDGLVRRVWRQGSPHNVVMVTNTCNCRCIMCPQPSCPDPDGHEAANLQMLRLVRDREVRHIGFTGGEPTLRLEYLCTLLGFCKKRFPEAAISLLTNGRRLSDAEVVRQIATVGHPLLTYCVSLHADVAELHDAIAGVPGSFAETVRGLHNLARFRQRVEIRVVLLSLNYQRLPALAEFIYRNFPFTSHIALMGMETTGLAWENVNAVWVDPTNYAAELRTAVHHLHQRALRVSVYNLPLCLLPEELRRFARDSISDWKKTYLPACQGCGARERCPGFFATSYRQSLHVRPLRSTASLGD